MILAPKITYVMCIPDTAKMCAMLAFLKFSCVVSSMSVLYPNTIPYNIDDVSSSNISFVFFIILFEILLVSAIILLA